MLLASLSLQSGRNYVALRPPRFGHRPKGESQNMKIKRPPRRKMRFANVGKGRVNNQMWGLESILLRVPRGFTSRLRLQFYRALGMRIGERNRMEGGGRIRRCNQIW